MSVGLALFGRLYLLDTAFKSKIIFYSSVNPIRDWPTVKAKMHQSQLVTIAT